MSIVSAVAVYFIVWWLCLFVVLPFGVRSQHEMEDVTLGSERGAPQRPRLLMKALATTVLATIVFAGIYLYFDVYGMRLEDLVP